MSASISTACETTPRLHTCSTNCAATASLVAIGARRWYTAMLLLLALTSVPASRVEENLLFEYDFRRADCLRGKFPTSAGD